MIFLFVFFNKSILGQFFEVELELAITYNYIFSFECDFNDLPLIFTSGDGVEYFFIFFFGLAMFEKCVEFTFGCFDANLFYFF